MADYGRSNCRLVEELLVTLAPLVTISGPIKPFMYSRYSTVVLRKVRVWYLLNKVLQSSYLEILLGRRRDIPISHVGVRNCTPCVSST